jgi:hypothetical protein
LEQYTNIETIHSKDYTASTIKECQCLIKYRENEILKIRYKKAGGKESLLQYNFEKEYFSIEGDQVVTWVPKYLDFFVKSERTRAAICYWIGLNGTQ